MKKPKKNKFRLSVKTADGFGVQSVGECSAAEAFALYMLPMEAGKAPSEGVAGEFWAARAAYIAAAGKCHEEMMAARAVQS